MGMKELLAAQIEALVKVQGEGTVVQGQEAGPETPQGIEGEVEGALPLQPQEVE